MEADRQQVSLLQFSPLSLSVSVSLCLSLPPSHVLPANIPPPHAPAADISPPRVPAFQGARLRQHRRGGPLQPPEPEGGPQPQPHQPAQLLQLQQQHGEPEQPPPSGPGPGRVQRPRLRVHVGAASVNGKARRVVERGLLCGLVGTMDRCGIEKPGLRVNVSGWWMCGSC